MTRLNRNEIYDKIYACWLGKNIGGTIGAPFERTREILNLEGFTSQKGEPLPNDDLDLQLIWLCAMEEVGPYRLTAKDLAEYWLQFIPPFWNEYGIGKSNLQGGILPPLSGELNNAKWKHSNGAWIRSEIWACLAPGYPEIARRYAFEDACVDHGMAEGTVAEQFTVTLESLAFIRTDIRGIIEDALEAIHSDSRVAKAVRLVIESYDRGDDWKDVRNALVKQSEDIGWFQAPANIGFVILGLLYGKGDFKKSLLYAVNCGDDTDCTAATVGAFLGILYGREGIPDDWAKYIGDSIVTCSLNYAYRRVCTIKNCRILTERVMHLIPTVLLANDIYAEYTDGETELDKFKIPHITSEKIRSEYDTLPLTHSNYNYQAWNSSLLRVRVEYNKEPIVKVGEEINIRIVFLNKLYAPLQADVKLLLPCGITAVSDSARVYIDHQKNEGSDCNFTITATEEIKASNRIIVEADIIGHPEPVLFAIPILSK